MKARRVALFMFWGGIGWLTLQTAANGLITRTSDITENSTTVRKSAKLPAPMVVIVRPGSPRSGSW